jgi:hypothetical protein
MIDVRNVDDSCESLKQGDLSHLLRHGIEVLACFLCVC